MFFISDDFICGTIKPVLGQSKTILAGKNESKPVIEVNSDLTLSTYFQSMLTYFAKREKPSDTLLTLKLKELLLNILQSSNNAALASYFCSLHHDDRPSIRQVMEANFCHNLTLEDYAQLCKRSLSSFKREFRKCYDIAPRKWLLKKRLEFAMALLKNTELNMSQICFECGFENLAHFSRVFKEEFGAPPSSYRKGLQLA